MNLRRTAKSEQGFTLIELLVVCVMIGILASTSLSLISYIFNANIRSAQIYDQQTTVDEAFGFLSARLATAQKPVGTLNDAGTEVSPVSISGDQLLFTSNGKCIRVWYAAWAKQIRGKISSSCSNADIKPIRGPNQPLPSGGNVAGTTGPDAPFYDQALDLFQSDGGFVLADNIVPDRPDAADTSLYRDPLQVFRYLNTNNDEINGVDAQADSTNSPVSTWYQTSSNRSDIYSITISAYVLPAGIDENDARVPARAYRQTMALEQVGGGGGSCTVIAAGMIRDHGRVDGQDGGTTETIGASSTGDVKRNASDPLETPVISTQDAWLNFNGSIKLPSGGTGTLHVQLMRDDGTTSGPVTDGGDGRYKFDFPFATTTPAVPFTGSFKIPTQTGAAEPSSTNYWLKVTITNDDASALTYSVNKNNMFLNYTVEAY